MKYLLLIFCFFFNILFLFYFILIHLNQFFVDFALGKQSSSNFATMAKFDLPAALDPSATPRLYKKREGGGGGGVGGAHFHFHLYSLQALLCFEPSSVQLPYREPFHCRCPSPAVLVPCSPPRVRVPRALT